MPTYRATTPPIDSTKIQTETVLDRLKSTLQLAITDAQYWDVCCDIVVELFGATGALLPPSNPHFRGVWMSGTAPMKAALAEYVSERWHLKDPREGLTQMMLDHGYATDDQLFPDREARAQIPFYRDFLLPHNFGNVCLIRILTPSGFWPMTVHFANDHPPLTTQDIERIKIVQDLFESAAMRAAEDAHKRIFDFAQFFKGTESEVLIFDADGNQCFNIDKTGRAQTANKLASLLPTEVSEDLAQEFREVLTSDPKQSLSKAYQFKEGHQTINVLVIQIPPTLRHFFMQFKACAIRTQCSDTFALKQSELRDAYDLSQKEVNTVALLAEGKTPNMIANILSLKPASVRQRLKLIYQKTQVNSQIELIALYARL